MNQPSRKVEWAVWGGLALIIFGIGGAFAWSRLGPDQLSLPVLGQLPEFTLTNQLNAPVTLASLRGKVWVADIIFSRCPSSCPVMTRQLADLQAVLPADGSVRLVTLTSDPEYDTPAVLERYAERFGADTNRWWFLTGSNPAIRSLAVNDFKFVVLEKPAKDREVPDDMFIHSTWFALVDQQGRVRGWTDRQGQLHASYESEDPGARARLLSAIAQLRQEKAP